MALAGKLGPVKEAAYELRKGLELVGNPLNREVWCKIKKLALHLPQNISDNTEPTFDGQEMTQSAFA